MNMFEEIRKDCTVLEEMIQNFADLYNYSRPMVEGRYPSLRLYKENGKFTRWMLLSMGLNDSGRRFTEYSENLPYEFSAGVFYDIDNELGFVRYAYNKVFWNEKKIPEVKLILFASLKNANDLISGLDKEFVQKNSLGVQIFKAHKV